MTSSSFEWRANQRVTELLRPENLPALEQFRFYGSTNKVYHIPLGDDPLEFVVVKLLPSEVSSFRRRIKRRIRDLLYGERDVNVGRERVRMEAERYQEWQEAGLRVPGLVETTLPDVRIIRGLPFPTFYTILERDDLPTARKLEVLEAVVRSLAHQHQTAKALDKKGLVHRDPGPWNIMFDLDRWETCWFDLEQPGAYPHMTVDDLTVRALRIFLYGVMDQLPTRLDDVIKVMIDHYEPKAPLWRLAGDLEASLRKGPTRIARLAGLRKRKFALQQRIASRLLIALNEQSAAPPLK